jgi:hypothetical protein
LNYIEKKRSDGGPENELVQIVSGLVIYYKSCLLTVSLSLCHTLPLLSRVCPSLFVSMILFLSYQCCQIFLGTTYQSGKNNIY